VGARVCPGTGATDPSGGTGPIGATTGAFVVGITIPAGALEGRTLLDGSVDTEGALDKDGPIDGPLVAVGSNDIEGLMDGCTLVAGAKFHESKKQTKEVRTKSSNVSSLLE
jgi:hypothetical protein